MCYGDTVTQWGFSLYKKNPDGTYSFDNYMVCSSSGQTNTGVTFSNPITYTLNNAPQNSIYSMDVSGLEPGTTYRYRAEVNSKLQGWIYAETESDDFTMLAEPEVATVGYTYTGGGTTNATYTLKGRIVKAGNPAYTKRGFVWCKSNITGSYVANPSLRANEHSASSITTASDTGVFSLTNFYANTPSVTYRFRAFAISGTDTVYGSVATFTSPSKPSMNFTGAYEAPYNYSENVTSSSIRLKTYLESSGGSALSGRGLVYTTSSSLSASTPTVSTVSDDPSDAATKWVKVASASASTQEVTISGLSANTTYYIRSYGTNCAGTGYSTYSKAVKTALNCGQTLTDQNGNTYNTARIGTQCWMKQNLKVTSYDNTLDFATTGTGTAISLQEGSSPTLSSVVAYRYNPRNSASNVSSYGYLYNWAATTGYRINTYPSSNANMMTSQGKKQGACPRGWHIPTGSELTTLHSNLNSNFNPQFAGRVSVSFQVPGSNVYYWSYDSSNDDAIKLMYVNYQYLTSTSAHSMLSVPASAYKQEGFSARCLQD